jgi:uncharacterized membrane protein
VVAPAVACQFPSVTGWTYRLLRSVCHQKPLRCLDIGFGPLPLCLRCFSLTAALCVARFAVQGRSHVWAAALCFPMVIDGLTAGVGLRESNSWLRVVTGALAGVGFHVYMTSFRWMLEER